MAIIAQISSSTKTMQDQDIAEKKYLSTMVPPSFYHENGTLIGIGMIRLYHILAVVPGKFCLTLFLFSLTFRRIISVQDVLIVSYDTSIYLNYYIFHFPFSPYGSTD
jgi:hypothetical protein